MFDPKDLFVISKEVYDGYSPNKCEQAFYRSLISSLYYSVYLSYREFSRDKLNINIDEEHKNHPKRTRHTLLVDILREKLKTRRYIGDMVDELRIHRINSDYHLNMIVEDGDLKRCLDIAEQLINELAVLNS